MASIVIPAHNEGRVIGRLLDAILTDAKPDEFEIVVVSNGSTDETVSVAQRFGGVKVLDSRHPSKHHALIAGDKAATRFPRLYVDADIEIDTASVRALVSALDLPQLHAVAPVREMIFDGCSLPVRSYYRVWCALPTVRGGLFGRGVVAVDQEGYARIAQRPEVLGDDLYVHSRFTADERMVVSGTRSAVRAPRTTADLVKRRVRAVEGNAEMDSATGGATGTSADTARQLVGLAKDSPRLILDVPTFVGITAYARLGARRRKHITGEPTWLRDESSRQ